MPLFSVIVPMYNVGKYAKQCIESILSQACNDFELILVDDGAKDSTPQIIDEYAETDSRIKVIHKENGGLVSARKAGANMAMGEYIVPVDGDDWVHQNCLQKYAEAIAMNPGIDLVCSNCFYASDDGKVKEHISYKKTGVFKKSYLEGKYYQSFSCFPQSQWAKAYKRELYKKYQNRIDDCITIGEDESLTIPMLYELNSIVILPDYLYYYRYNPESMTKSRKKEWSTEGLLARLKLLGASLELNSYNLETQFTAYVVHATINQCLSYFKANKCSIACEKTKKLLDNDLIKKYISQDVKIANKKEKLAKFALKHKLYVLLEIYSLSW